MSTETAEKVIVNPVTKEEMIELLKTDLLAWNKWRMENPYTHIDLVGASLVRACLYGADIRHTTGNLREIRSIHCFERVITYSADRMWIGCQNHTIEEWWAFTDAEISNMSGKALERWTKWKPLLQPIIAAYPATPIIVGTLEAVAERLERVEALKTGSL